MSWIKKESRQWQFVSARLSVSERLLKIPTENPLISYIALTTISDNTGNQIVHGLILTSERCDVDVLRTVIGPMFIFSMLSNIKITRILLVEILINEFQESGNPLSSLKSLRNKVIKLKQAIQAARGFQRNATPLLNLIEKDA